jgi:hypothetical protein
VQYEPVAIKEEPSPPPRVQQSAPQCNPVNHVITYKASNGYLQLNAKEEEGHEVSNCQRNSQSFEQQQLD